MGTKKEAVRQSNDGQALKGRELSKKQVYSNLQSSSSKTVAARENAKQHVAAQFVGFQSDYGSGRDNRDRRGGDPRNNNKRNNNKGGMANIDDKNAFPALGAK